MSSRCGRSTEIIVGPFSFLLAESSKIILILTTAGASESSNPITASPVSGSSNSNQSLSFPLKYALSSVPSGYRTDGMYLQKDARSMCTAPIKSPCPVLVGT